VCISILKVFGAVLNMVDRLRSLFSFRTVLAGVIAFLLLKHAQTTLENFNKEGSHFPSAQLLSSNDNLIPFPNSIEAPWVALFWSVTCGPCRVEMELIQKAIEAGYVSADRVYAIHIGGDKASVQEHMKSHGFTFQFLVDVRGELAQMLDVGLTPTTFLVNKDGTIRWASSGLGVTHVFRMAEHLR
jgi:peroxiredoxin